MSQEFESLSCYKFLNVYCKWVMPDVLQWSLIITFFLKTATMNIYIIYLFVLSVTITNNKAKPRVPYCRCHCRGRYCRIAQPPKNVFEKKNCIWQMYSFLLIFCYSLYLSISRLLRSTLNLPKSRWHSNPQSVYVCVWLSFRLTQHWKILLLKHTVHYIHSFVFLMLNGNSVSQSLALPFATFILTR